MQTFFVRLTTILCAVLSSVIIPENARAAEEPIIQIARFVASPGREEELEARLIKTVAHVHKTEPGLTYRLFRSKDNPAMFIFYEVYPSKAALDFHRNVSIAEFRKEHGLMPEGVLARAIEVEVFVAVPE